MDQRTESIKQDIDATRDAMTEKMEQIESRVKGTVEDLKGSVEETVETVKQAFDMRHQVDQRPWTMLGASVLTGYVLGNMGGSDSSRSVDALPYYPPPAGVAAPGSEYQSRGYGNGQDQKLASYPSSYPASPASPQQRSTTGFMTSIMDQFGDELDVLKDAAVVTIGNMLRDLLKKNLPEFAEEFERARQERERENKAADASTTMERAVGRNSDAGY